MRVPEMDTHFTKKEQLAQNTKRPQHIHISLSLFTPHRSRKKAEKKNVWSLEREEKRENH